MQWYLFHPFFSFFHLKGFFVFGKKVSMQFYIDGNITTYWTIYFHSFDLQFVVKSTSFVFIKMHSVDFSDVLYYHQPLKRNIKSSKLVFSIYNLVHQKWNGKTFIRLLNCEINFRLYLMGEKRIESKYNIYEQKYITKHF